MSYLYFFNIHRPFFIQEFDLIALNAMRDAYRRAKSKSPHEPDFVASLVKHGVPEIKNIMDKLFVGKGIKVATTGVFCHQSPMVRFTDGCFKGSRCELGDILFVHFHKNHGGMVQKNALLLQAKMTTPSASKLNISSKEQPQLALYQSWPNFQYDMNLDPLNGKIISVYPKARHAGAQYLLIDSHPMFASPNSSAGQYPMAIWMAETPLYTFNSFGNVLFDFLAMSSGRVFSGKPVLDGWSSLVWDLIENGLKKGFTRTRTGHKPTTGSRVEGDPIPYYACFSMGHGQMTQSIISDVLGNISGIVKNKANDDGSTPPELLDQFDFQEPIGGIYLIFIETDESDIE